MPVPHSKPRPPIHSLLLTPLLLAPLLLAPLGAGCGGASAPVGHLVEGTGVDNICPDGTCMMETPKIVNVFWSQTIADFDADVAAAGLDTYSFRVDGLTAALVHSDHFLGRLTQYGLKSVTTGPSIAAGACGAASGHIEDAKDKMHDLAECILSNNFWIKNDKDNIILNVIIPPSIVRKPGGGWCNGKGTSSAEHNKYGDGISIGPITMTFVPVYCNSSMWSMGTAITHELDETITDPVPTSSTGWKDRSQIPTQEIGDLCEDGADASWAFMSQQLGSAVSQYWSDSDAGCSPGFDTTPPEIQWVTACGAGSHMTLAAKGVFGGKPWDMTTIAASPGDNGRTTSMYLSVNVTPKAGNKWSAGRIMAGTPDVVSLGVVDWTNGANEDAILIHGFDKHHGDVVNGQTLSLRPGDGLEVSVTRVDNGQRDRFKLSVPEPQGFTGLEAVATDQFGSAADGWIYFDRPALIRGAVNDAGGCGEEAINISFISDEKSQPGWWVLTDADGKFGSKLQATGAAGHRWAQGTVVGYFGANLDFDVHPRFSGLDYDVGGVAGGQTLHLSGAGFPMINGGNHTVAVSFRDPANPANRVDVQPAALSNDGKSLQIATPVSPLPGSGVGLVDVVVVVNGVDSNPISYLYVVPMQPVLTLLPPPCPGIAGRIFVDAYDAKGFHVVEPVKLSSPSAVFAGGVATVNTSSGSAVWLGLNVGPQISVTATATPPNGQLPPPPVTRSFNVVNASPDCLVQFNLAEYFTFDPGGPVESVELPAVLVQDGRYLEWSFPSVAAVHGAVSLSTERGATPRSPGLAVSQVGASALHALTRGGGFGFVLPGHARQFKGIAALAGQAFGLSVQRGFAGAATVSFALPAGADPSSYAVFGLAPGGSGWVETSATARRVPGAVFLDAAVSSSGTYALAQLQ